jgi:hypothetical protein
MILTLFSVEAGGRVREIGAAALNKVAAPALGTVQRLLLDDHVDEAAGDDDHFNHVPPIGRGLNLLVA